MKESSGKIRKLRRLFIWAVRLSLLTSIVGGAVLFVRYPPSFLRVKEIVVMSPLKHLDEFELIRLSEVKKGDNILTLPLKDVRKRILRYPWVKEVRLSKRLPARLFIWVEEEEPAGLLEMTSSEGSGELFLVSREGRVFKKLDAEDPKDFPILTGLAHEEVHERLPRLMALVKSLETSDLFNAIGVSEARWDSKTGLTLFTKEPCIRLMLGPEEGNLTWEERIKRFIQAWGTLQVQGQSPAVVDLSLDRRIVVKPKL